MSTASIGGIGKIARGEDRKAARAGTEVEHAFDLGRFADQGRGVFIAVAAEMGVQQFADEGARHDGALVDIERQAAHIDLVDEIGRGFAGGDALIDQTEDFLAFRGGDARGGKAFELVGMQMQGLANQECRFGHRIGGAMREHQFRLGKAADGVADEIEQRQQFARGDLRRFRGDAARFGAGFARFAIRIWSSARRRHHRGCAPRSSSCLFRFPRASRTARWS